MLFGDNAVWKTGHVKGSAILDMDRLYYVGCGLARSTAKDLRRAGTHTLKCTMLLVFGPDDTGTT